MLFSEILALIVFIVFWWFIYFHEIKFLIPFFKHKKLPQGLFIKFIHAFAILGIIWFFYSYLIEPYRLKINHINLTSAKIKKSFTIVQISDLHCDIKIRNEEKLVKIINEINPDIIVFTGDAINTKKALGVFQKTLKALKAKSGRFAVRGNFDVWQWKDIDLFRDTGFVELDGTSASLTNNGQCIIISGLAAENNIEKLKFLERISENCYTVLLFHYPGINEAFTGLPIDLYLAGHTHGGQFSLPFYGALVTMSSFGKKYEAGLYALSRNRYLYVNRGIGMEGGFFPRIRFFSRPEIAVFHINPEKAQ